MNCADKIARRYEDIRLTKVHDKIDVVKLSYLTGREHCYISTSLDERVKDD